MASLQLYSNAYVFIDGLLLTQENSVSVEAKSGMIPVFNVVDGLGGMTQGASTVEVKVDEAVPGSDFEFNPGPYMRTGAVVEVKVQMANRVAVYQGFITDSSFSHSVNDSSKISLSFLGRLSDFE
jgi:hypothetical protein